MGKNENSYNFGHFIENIHLKDVALKEEAVTGTVAILKEFKWERLGRKSRSVVMNVCSLRCLLDNLNGDNSKLFNKTLVSGKK